MSFVGYKQFISASELQKLLEDLAQAPSYCFLQWAHTVSGVLEYSSSSFPPASLKGEFPSPEGQLFNAELELRWKRQGNCYDVLLLSTISDKAEGFTAISGDWETIDRTAHFYDTTDAQFPKGFIYPDNLPIHQRYFRNSKTATIHFVALTIAKSL